MNYRHAYHAGNFADCFKHALLVALLASFERKSAPYFVLDTHAGAGQYDLENEAALRTAEADLGIRRLLQRPSPLLERYLGLVGRPRIYPGSPKLVSAMLRGNDRLACCELQQEDRKALRRLFTSCAQVEVHGRSGWEALAGLLPPKEKRGLVFIDPPFEEPDEFGRLAGGLRLGHSRFGNGVFAAWYPVKRMASVRDFHAGMARSGIRDIVSIELHLREPTNADRLNGCGLIVVNAPYQFEDQGIAIANAVLSGVGEDEAGAGVSLIRIADE